MKRYFSSFAITSFIYAVLIVGFFYGFQTVKKVNIQKQETISLNHISLVQQKKLVKKAEDKKVKKLKKKKLKKKIEVKKLAKKTPVQTIKEVKTVKTIIKKRPETKKESLKKEVIEKEQNHKNQVLLKKTALKYDYKKEFIQQHLKKIIALIQKNMIYPKRAKRFNIQGEVLVEFTITKEGDIKNFKTISGHRLLQKSTINAIKNASKYFPEVKKSITLIVPVHYKLT